MSNRICGFCRGALKYKSANYFDLFLCRDCQEPKYTTLHRQVCYAGQTQLLADSLRINDFYVIRYFHPARPNERSNYTVIYKDILGAIDHSPDMEPITLTKPVCDIDHLVELPMDNIELLIQKLSLWTTFS